MDSNIFLADMKQMAEKVGLSEENNKLVTELFSSIVPSEVLGSFFHLKKNPEGEGLAFELMFFNSRIIYDIVITSSTIDFSSLQISSINMISLTTNNSSYGEDNLEIKKRNEVKLTISYGGGGPRGLFYETDLRRFSDLLNVKNELSKISQS